MMPVQRQAFGFYPNTQMAAPSGLRLLTDTRL